jgi:hypothetical protein
MHTPRALVCPSGGKRFQQLAWNAFDLVYLLPVQALTTLGKALFRGTIQ